MVRLALRFWLECIRVKFRVRIRVREKTRVRLR